MAGLRILLTTFLQLGRGSVSRSRSKAPATTATLALMASLALLGAAPAKAAIALGCDGPQAADVAVVIGNSRYAEPLHNLDNPAADADLVAEALSEGGMTVHIGKDLDFAAMRAIVERAAACTTDRFILYFAGQGGILEDGLYALPAGAGGEEAGTLAGFRRQAHAVADLLGLAASSAGAPSLEIFAFFDGCSEDLTASLRPDQAAATEVRTLTEVLAGSPGVHLVVFSGSLGQRVLDADPTDGSHGPFAAALASQLRSGDGDLDRMLVRIRDDVSARTGGQQVPTWYRAPELTPTTFGSRGRIIEFDAR